MSVIKKSTFNFLHKLARNNNKDWFAENKSVYQEALDNIKLFKAALEEEVNKHDLIDKAKIFRIYRDVRFSKDKTPYKQSFSGSFSRGSSALRGGYYWQIQPGNTMAAVGFFNPNPADLKLIRTHIAAEDKPLRKILKNKNFAKMWGEMEGNQVKTAPKGFNKDHHAIDLLRFKQYLFTIRFDDEEVLSPDFYKKLNHAFIGIRPYFDYMSEILTHDLNGVSLLAEK